MALDERSRHELYLRLEETLGPEAATTLMEHLPPVGWADVATKRDLDQLAVAAKGDLEHAVALLQADLEATEQRLRADFRGEIQRTFAEQTRILVLTQVSTTIGAVFTTAVLAFAAARLT